MGADRKELSGSEGRREGWAPCVVYLGLLSSSPTLTAFTVRNPHPDPLTEGDGIYVDLSIVRAGDTAQRLRAPVVLTKA